MKLWSTMAVAFGTGITIVTILVFVNVYSAVLGDVEESPCTIAGSSLDDLEQIKSECTEIFIEDLEVPAGTTLDLTNLQNGTTVTFRGIVTFGYEEWSGFLISVSGHNIRIKGESDHMLDGEGHRWWDGLGSGGGITKPRFFQVNKLYDSIIEDIYILNTPRHCFAINNCDNVTFSRIIINDLEGDFNGGKNTDGFGVGTSNNIIIRDSHVVNQDDCIAPSSGSNYYFYNNYCSGGHGISIGSIGNKQDNVLDNVHVKDCVIVHSENGVRIKTVYNATGWVKNVVYENITLGNITDYGIVIRGDYYNGAGNGIPTDGVKITNLTLTDIHGWVQPSGTDVFVFLADGVAEGWNWTHINITGGTNFRECTGVPDASGVVCT